MWLLGAAVLLGQAAALPPAPRPPLSATADPACATPVPPPLTAEQIAAYRARQAQPRPALPPATSSVPIRDGAMPKHRCFLKRAARGNIDLLFVGDSITDFFGRENRGAAAWRKHFGPLRAANFGISGDTTQDVLWRMQNGELDSFRAKLIVLMLGTNNIGRNPDEEIAAGDAAIVAEFRKRQPSARILLLGVFPRGEPTGKARQSVNAINARLAAFADNRHVFYRDLSPVFLNADGTLKDGAMVDGLHPGPKGYELWAEAILPDVRRLMQ